MARLLHLISLIICLPLVAGDFNAPGNPNQSLEKFPPEILTHIFSYLIKGEKFNENKENYLHLMLTCLEFKNVACHFTTALKQKYEDIRNQRRDRTDCTNHLTRSACASIAWDGFDYASCVRCSCFMLYQPRC